MSRKPLTYLFLFASLMGMLCSASDTFAAACISGFVRDRAGNPVADGDIDVFDAMTGQKLVTPNDNTDAGGFYTICVLPGQYYVAYAPPDSSHLIGKRVFNVDLRDNQPQAINVVLDSGVAVSGTITNSLFQPVGDVDIDVDSIGGGRVYTPNDNSHLATGAYWIVVPTGWFRIRYDSPVGSRLPGLEFDSVHITSDTVIDLAMADGWILSGQVQNTIAEGLFDVELSLRDAVSGAKQFVSNNNTDSLGAYTIAVPSGLYELQFAGQPGSDIIGKSIDSVDINSDLVWNEVLAQGLIMDLILEDELGTPISKADIDIKLMSTAEKLFTPNDRTDDSGRAWITLPPDTYQLEVDPPVGSPYDQVIIPNLILGVDTSITVVMPTVLRVALAGRVVDESGAGIGGVQLSLVSIATGREVFVPDNETVSTGEFSLATPIGSFDLRVAPPVGERLVGETIRNLSIGSDSALSNITLREGILATFEIRDIDGFPVENVDLDLADGVTGLELYTPHDNTDASGIAVVAAHAGEYSILIDPPTESGFQPVAINRVALLGDTLLTFLLGADLEGGYGNVQVGQNYPNPFNSSTSIPLTLTAGTQVEVEIFNVLGQSVRVITDRYYSAGRHDIPWDCKDSNRKEVSSGIYFYRVTSEVTSSTRKMLLIN